MKKYPKISIIIPLYVLTDYFYESVYKCLELDYSDFEILICIDKEVELPFKNNLIKVLKTGEYRTGPAEKRDIGILEAKGELIAFLDDDSYPQKDWLKKAAEIFFEQKVAAICGPGLTPPVDGFSQKITGSILGSPFGSGIYYYRFVKGAPRYVDDYPAYNMIIKRDVLLKIGGFNTKFYGGEDTAICIKLINSGEKIYYHPDLVVYHHRRRFPFEYMKQVGNVGLHRGYFVKAFPQTSLRPIYFGPAMITILLPVFFILALLNTFFLYLFFSLSVIIYFIMFAFGFKNNSLMINLVLPFAVLVNHLTYGFQFLKGLLLVSKLER